MPHYPNSRLGAFNEPTFGAMPTITRVSTHHSVFHYDSSTHPLGRCPLMYIVCWLQMPPLYWPCWLQPPSQGSGPYLPFPFAQPPPMSTPHRTLTSKDIVVFDVLGFPSAFVRPSPVTDPPEEHFGSPKHYGSQTEGLSELFTHGANFHPRCVGW